MPNAVPHKYLRQEVHFPQQAMPILTRSKFPKFGKKKQCNVSGHLAKQIVSIYIYIYELYQLLVDGF